MSMLSDKNKNALGGLALAQTASDFSIIQDPDCAGVLCQARISSHILAWLASLDPACLPKARGISHNACSRFHIDALTARLICTYRGTGTQYGLANAAGDPETIHTVPTGAAIVLRGKRWPSKAKLDLVHRSPPIQCTGQTRLVLVLDSIADLDEGV